jgi:hypothetical protein
MPTGSKESNIRKRVELGSAMTGLAALLVSGVVAAPAGAALTAVKAKPSLVRYEIFSVVPPARSRDVDKINAAASERVLAPALAAGALVGYGDDENLVSSRERATHSTWWQATSLPGALKLIDAFDKADSSSSPQLASATEHWGRLYSSRYYNWKAGSWKGAYRYRFAYSVKPGVAPWDVADLLSTFYVPILEKLLADGIVVQYEIDTVAVHSADSPGQVMVSMVVPSAEDLAKLAFPVPDDEGPMIEAAKAGVLSDRDAPHIEYLRVNLTYK